MDFTVSWHIASTIWVLDAHRVIFRSESKWPPGSEICDFVGSGCPTCGRTFLRHYVMDFSESWHIASTIWVPDARRVIFRSESKWPPGGTICDFLGSGCPTCGGTFLRHYVIDFSESWHIASTIWVPDAHQVIYRSDSKWPPGGKICDFFGSGCPTCGLTFLRHYVMDFSESWHIASTIWVPDARRVIFRSESKWPPGGKICDIFGSGCPMCGLTFLRHYVMDFSESWHIASTI